MVTVLVTHQEVVWSIFVVNAAWILGMSRAVNVTHQISIKTGTGF
jgi:hypothetical protein